MILDEKDLCRIAETAYLNQENTWRYRAIVHYCYKKHAHMQTYVYPEDIYHALQGDTHFAAYSFDQLEQDLAQLVEWNNLKPHQETGRARSIVDFKRRRYRYQCTPYTVEIERMVEKLRQVGEEFGGSLETTQFDRILQALTVLVENGDTLASAELNQTWADLQHYFQTLIRNASDYLAHLKSAKVEERMQTAAFIIYKDKITQYLQNFVLGLQRSSVKIEKLLKEFPIAAQQQLFARLAAYQLERALPGEQRDLAAYAEDFRESYVVIKEWFLGTEYRQGELQALSQETLETIRRITKFAQRLAEQHQVTRSRKADYLYLAKWFARLPDKSAADELSAALFGVSGVRHFYAQPRESDSIDARIEEEAPTAIELKPHVSTYRERTRQTAIREQRENKAALLREHLVQQRKHDALLDALVVDGQIDLATLPRVSAEVRKTLLGWIARCLQQRTGEIQTETGRHVRLLWNRHSQQRVCLKSEDGDFLLPAMKLVVTAAKAG